MALRFNRRRSRVLLPLICLLLALDLTVTAGMSANVTTLDLTFGKGRRVVISGEADKGLSADYYQQRYRTSAKAQENAMQVSRRISDEGIVLLKNDGTLPLSDQAAVTPLGLRFIQPYYGGTGSSAISTAPGDVVTPVEGLRGVFSHINESAVTAQQNAASNGMALHRARPLNSEEEAHVLCELPVSALLPLADTCRETVAIVYIGRQTGEDTDACTSPYDDGTPHMLALTKAEHELIDFAAASCRDVVVVLCSASAMQIPELAEDERVSAILWVGGAGSTGYASLADILSGRVNPSGRLPVTFAEDFTNDPTFANHDDGSDRFTYSNVRTTLITNQAMIAGQPAAFHEYEEGVYVGYRYYETACALGYLADLGSRAEGVAYPFGHGLSYTTFTQRITEVRCVDNQAGVTVEVTNTGTESGKTVVQLYVERPYTDMDRALKIEKSSVDLLQFSKTALLRPGEKATVTLFFPLDQMASYCAGRNHLDGSSGGYILEAGDYRLSLRHNSHQVIDSATLTVKETHDYSGNDPRPSELEGQSEVDIVGGDPSDYVGSVPMPATDRFTEMNRYALGENSGMVTLSRADWPGTQPTSPTATDREASAETAARILENDAAKRPTVSAVQSSKPASGADNGVVLADLRGRAYDDPLWEVLLDQIDFTQQEALRQTLFQGGYGTAALDSVRLPATVAYDGPQGLTLADVSGKNWLKNMCGYPAAPVLAATWNHDLMYDFGASVGQEALTAGVHGWYAPGLNILRSPFCGRSSEYFSEDPLLAGLLGARVLSGAGDNGLSCAVKHFPLMETENHRSANTCTWMTEQTLREIYMKPFELALKFSRKTLYCYSEENSQAMVRKTMRAGDFIMVSDSAVGSRWSAVNAELLTEIVRGEWGFEGAIITDMHQAATSAMLDSLLAAGCDLFMSCANDPAIMVSSSSDPALQTHLRRAVKNLCYTFVNSSLTQHMAPDSVVEYHLSPWRVGLVAANVLVLLICAAGVACCFERQNRHVV